MPMLFIETDSPPPFYQENLSDEERKRLDQWFIGHRSQAYYLKRFAQFDKQGYLSPKWHWASFFMTLPWLLYRKRYLDAIVYSVAGWSFIQLNITIILVAFEFLAMDYVPEVYQMTTRIAIAVMIWLFWAVMVARWTDAYYYRMARREIADALEFYPKEPEQQAKHLRHEGGVSLFGMGLAFSLFGFLLLVINTQFLPIIAKREENRVLFEAYNVTKNAQARVDSIYRQLGKCPLGLPLSSDESLVHLTIKSNSSGIPNSVKTDCVLEAKVRHVPFPNRYLNGQTLVLYRKQDGQWGCISSLNRKQVPKSCTAR